ncbi:MAG: c-type cytochrome [Magnetococcales bacterium]|nr:c-type cytochrome [Magnetococcales bacterium]
MFDYPVFDMPLMGHRLIFAFDAIVHVFISHGAAVGGSIILTLAQWLAIKENDSKFDELAYKILFTFFILATAIGALTGIGIWVHVNIINPAAIGALLRVFFWKWFVEWIVFNVEMIFLLWWFLTWRKYPLGTPGKRFHFKLGATYAISSWFTMAIITAILGFMMTPGNWLKSEFPTQPDYLASLMNPSWIPSLGFRTFFSVGWAAAAAMFLSWFFTKNDEELRLKATRFFGKILGVSVPLFLVFGYWYYQQFPQQAKDLFTIGAVTRQLAGNPVLPWVLTGGLAVLALIGGGMLYANPKRAPMAVALALMVGCMGLMAEFERVREFVRKPYIIYGYMYANGVRVIDVPVLNRDGFLKRAAFVPDELKTVTPTNKLAVGKALYQMQCRYCHTVDGVNAIRDRIKGWDEKTIFHRIGSLNSPTTPFMPPFSGTQAEREALAAYLASLNKPSAIAIAH